MNIYRLCYQDGFQPQKKHIAPLLAAALPAIVSGGASILSSGIGALSQSSANRTNVGLMHEQNEFQAAENQKSRDWQETMWNKQNEYNSPKNQVALYKQAGLNPFLLNGSTTQSAAGSAGTPSMSSAPAPAHVAPVNPAAGMSDAFSQIYNSLQQGMQVQSNQKLQSAEAIKTLVESVTTAYEKFGHKGYHELMKAVAPILKNIQLEGTRSDILFSEQLKNNLSMRYNQDMDSLNKEVQYTLGKKYGAQQIQSNLSKLEYDIAEIVGRLNTMRVQNKALIDKTAAEVVKLGAEAFMLKKEGDKFVADAKTVNSMRQWLLKTVQYESKIKGIQSYFADVNRQASSKLVDWVTSDEGQEARKESSRISDIWSSDALLRSIDKLFGDYVKIFGSVSTNGSTSGSNFNYNPQNYNVMQ